MQFTTSKPADGDYYQSEEYCVMIDDKSGTIRFQKTLVRYGPGDDFETITDDVMAIAEFEKNKGQQELLAAWFGEDKLREALAAIRMLD